MTKEEIHAVCLLKVVATHTLEFFDCPRAMKDYANVHLHDAIKKAIAAFDWDLEDISSKSNDKLTA